MTSIRSEEIMEFFDWTSLHDHQKIYIRTRARNPLEVGAVGSGKTRAGICRAMCYSSNTPYFGDLAGNKGIISRLSRTDLIDTTMSDFIELIEPTGWIKRLPKQPRYILELINESEIQFVPMEDYMRFLSRELGWAYFEQIEQGDQSKGFEEIDLHRLRKTKTKFGEPILFHSAFAVCNPCENWVYDTWGLNEEKLTSKDEKERKGYNPDFLTIHSSTYENAVNLPPDYIPNMEKKYGGRNSKKGKMYLQGQWGSVAGSVYDWTDNYINDEDIWPPLEHPTYISLDYGWGSEGVTSVGFWSLDKVSESRTEVLRYDELYLKGYPSNGIEETVEAIDNLLQFHFVKRLDNSFSLPDVSKIEIKLWPCDPALQARRQRANKYDYEETIIDAFCRLAGERGLQMALSPSNNNIALGTNEVNWMLINGLMRFNPRCTKVRTSLKNYIWDDNRPGEIKKLQDDHPADDVRYFVMSLSGTYRQPKPEVFETLIERIRRKRKQQLKNSTGIDLGSVLVMK